jgi:cytochrome c oxidase subunit 4
MSDDIIPVRLYVKTWAALLVLLLATVGAAYLPLGPFNTVVALGIAAVKALLIVLIFMHIRWSVKILHLAAIAGVLWLSFLISLIAMDYLTRSWIPHFPSP